MKEQVKIAIIVLKDMRDLLRKNNRWTFWAFIFGVLAVIIAVTSILIATGRLTNQLNITGGARTNDVSSLPHLDTSFRRNGLPQGFISGTFTLNSEANSPLLLLAHKIIQCESEWKETAVGDGGKAYGLAQFHKPTWNWLTKLYKVDLDYYNSQHQIELLLLALEDGRCYLWTCCPN